MPDIQLQKEVDTTKPNRGTLRGKERFRAKERQASVKLFQFTLSRVKPAGLSEANNFPAIRFERRKNNPDHIPPPFFNNRHRRNAEGHKKSD